MWSWLTTWKKCEELASKISAVSGVELSCWQRASQPWTAKYSTTTDERLTTNMRFDLGTFNKTVMQVGWYHGPVMAYRHFFGWLENTPPLLSDDCHTQKPVLLPPNAFSGLKISHMHLWLCPRPLWGSLQRSPRSPSWLGGGGGRGMEG